MTAEDLLKALSDIAAADALSYWIVAALTAMVFVVMRTMLPVKGLAILFAPAIFWGGLVGIYVAGQAGFVVSTERSAQIVVSSGMGMIVGLVVMILLVRLADTITRIRKPVAQPGSYNPGPARRVR